MEDTTSQSAISGKSFRHSFASCLMSSLVILPIIAGCAQPAVNTSAALATPATPLNRASDHYEWIKRLQATTPAEHVQQVAAPGSQVSYPISVPMSAGAHYALVVNQQLRMAWLQSSNGTTGPWPLDQPDVTHLLKSVAIPPTNPPAGQ